MNGTFLEISDDISKYLDLDQLTTVSLVSTSSFFRGLNNLKYNRFIPSGNIDIFVLIKQQRTNSLSKTEDIKLVLRAFKSLENVNINDGESEYDNSIIRGVAWNTELTKALIKMGADVNLGSPFLVAVSWRNIDASKILMEAGADVNELEEITAEPEWIDILIKGGLDVSFKNRERNHLFDLTDQGVDAEELENGLNYIDYLLNILKSNELLIDAGADLEEDYMKVKTKIIGLLDNSDIFEFLEKLYGTDFSRK